MTTTASIKDRAIIFTRLINAPRELVWEAWTNPEHIKQWWGPNGFRSSIFQMDVIPGGVWDFIMHGPDGRDYKNKSIYKEVVKPEKLVYDHVSGPAFEFSVTFADEGNKTLISIQMLFASAEQLNKVVKEFNAAEGLRQNIDKLEMYLEKGYPAEELVFTRLINAPLELVFKAWTDKNVLQQWWGPTGFTSPVCEADARPGGKIYIDMKGSDGTIYPTEGEFHEVDAPERLVFTIIGLNEKKERLFESRNTLTLKEEAGKTRLSLHVKVSMISPGGLLHLNGMNEGWSQCLERLIHLTGNH